jgi:signal transduction histidine kinase
MDSSEKDIYSALMIAFAIIGVILLYFFVSIVRQQKRYRKLSKAKINAEITTMENERKRIAADLHDDVGPLLSAIKLHINYVDVTDEEQKNLLAKSSRYIDEVIQKMREISNELLPNILVRRGLGSALNEFILKLNKSNGLNIVFESDLQNRLPQEVEINLYRIVQEIVHNSIKHSKAKRLRIELRAYPDKIVLATADDGIGFSENPNQNTDSGLGLLNLQSRTDVMGGDLNCLSQTGRGVRYLIEIPL